MSPTPQSRENSLYHLLLRVMFRVPPERIHHLAFAAMSLVTRFSPLRRLVGKVLVVDDPVLRNTVFGLDFPAPLGLAAGFDKDATGVDAWGPARIRFRRGRHRHRPGAARQPRAPPVPAAGRPRPDQPDGFQQPRCGQRREPSPAAPRRCPDRREHRQDQDRRRRRRAGRLHGQRTAARSAGRFHGRQRQLPEHPGTAGPAGRRIPAARSCRRYSTP